MTQAPSPGERGPAATDPQRGEPPQPDATQPAEPTNPDGWQSRSRQRLRAGWRTVTSRGRVALLLAVLAALLGAVTGWREWTGIAAALAVLLLAAVVSALGRSSCAVTLELDRRRFVVGDVGTSVVQVSNTANRRMFPLRMELEVARAVRTGGRSRCRRRAARWSRSARCGRSAATFSG